eukprot:scaffold941_cov37-Tisochrysis_lutea.AAC.2
MAGGNTPPPARPPTFSTALMGGENHPPPIPIRCHLACRGALTPIPTAVADTTLPSSIDHRARGAPISHALPGPCVSPSPSL